jgi:hypothetical protein
MTQLEKDKLPMTRSTPPLLNDFTPERELARASTLPARWYTEPDFLALEKEKIFFKTWQWVGSAGLVQRPGDFFTHDLYGEPLVVTRTKEGGQARWRPGGATAKVCNAAITAGPTIWKASCWRPPRWKAHKISSPPLSA